MKNNKNTIFISLIALFAIFAIALTAFYINRDVIYKFLRGTEISDDKSLSGGIVPLEEYIPEPYEYFSDIIFLGDSIMTGFDIYRDYIEFDGEKVLKNVTVAASVGYGVNNAVSYVTDNSINLIYNDKAMRPEDIAAERNEKYVFICLGLNDLVVMNAEKYIKKYCMLIDNIESKNPDKTVVVLSVTPLVARQQGGNMTNDAINAANSLLLEFATERNIPFIDWAEAVRGEDNALRKDLSSLFFIYS